MMSKAEKIRIVTELAEKANSFAARLRSEYAYEQELAKQQRGLDVATAERKRAKDELTSALAAFDSAGPL